MYIVPVLIDDWPSFATSTDASASVLAMPCVDGTIRELWRRLLSPMCEHVPHEVQRGEAIHARKGLAQLVRDPLSLFDPFDWVLFVSARLVPLSPDGIVALHRRHKDGDNSVLHLLATSPEAVASRELVYTAPDGGRQRIQRYLDPVTATQPTSGVIASLVPVQSLLRLEGVSTISSLDMLRAELVQRGVPTADLQQDGHVYDVAEEESALAFVHQRVRDAYSRAPGDTVARARGAVIIERGAFVSSDVLIVGPTLVAAGAVVGAGARLAQCIVLPGTEVPPGASVRQRIVSGPIGAAIAPQRRHASTPTALANVAIRPHPAPYLGVRAWIDATVALVALVLLSPLFAVIAMVIKMTSSGPVFYGDRREGLAARPFRCWKFRTMRVNAHALQRELAAEQFADGPHFKMERDPRLTSIGGWLRRLNIDELPQLFNVLCREMSLVGPRPSPLRENQICAPWRRARLSVRPGITGLWQVCRHNRSEGDFHQWIEFDLRYVERVSFAVDLRILIATVMTGGGRRPVSVASVIPETITETIPVDVPEIDAAIVSARKMANNRELRLNATRKPLSASPSPTRWPTAESVK